jgi:hypothetical protein
LGKEPLATLTPEKEEALEKHYWTNIAGQLSSSDDEN